MDRVECVVTNKMNQSAYSAKAATGVDEAITRVTLLVNSRRGRDGTTKQQAFRQVATESHLSSAEVRKLYQPSRRPKQIGLGVWHAISGAYFRFLRHEISKLEAEINRVEALDGLDLRTRDDLVGKAQALIARITQSL